jgi:plastocyanin
MTGQERPNIRPLSRGPRRHPRRLLLGLAALAASSGLVAACGSSSHPGSAPTTGATSLGGSAAVTGTTLTIKNFAFSPSALTVSPGAKVTVHNDDSATHTVTAVDPHNGAFNTRNVGPGGTVTFIAPTTAGSYSYICMIHQFMHGTLVVT